MGVFDDKKFEELDWISQATEPIDSKLNEVLGKLPDEFTFTFPIYKKMVTHSYDVDLSIGRAIAVLMIQSNIGFILPYNQASALEKCFKLEIIGDDVVIDFEKEMIIGGEVRIVKIVSTMDEKVLENMLGSEGIDYVAYSNLNTHSLSRINEVMEIFGKCEEGLKSRSPHKKRTILVNRMKTLFKNNEWKIKDTELANKVGLWVRDYIVDGNLAAFSNFCRLKVMTHKEQAIYSMEEVQ